MTDKVALAVKILPASAGDKRRRLGPWVGKLPRRRTWQPTPACLPENPMDGGAWRAAAYSMAKSQTRPNLARTCERVVGSQNVEHFLCQPTQLSDTGAQTRTPFPDSLVLSDSKDASGQTLGPWD